MESDPEAIVHEALLDDEIEAKTIVQSYFPGVMCTVEDDTTYYDVRSRRVAFHCELGEHVHLVFVRRSDVVGLLRRHADKALLVIHDEHLCFAYPARVVREIVAAERSGVHAPLIPRALENHHGGGAADILVIRCAEPNPAGTFALKFISESELAVAVRKGRKHYLRVV